MSHQHCCESRIRLDGQDWYCTLTTTAMSKESVTYMLVMTYRAGQSRAGQGRAGQGRAGQSTTGQGRTGQIDQ